MGDELEQKQEQEQEQKQEQEQEQEQEQKQEKSPELTAALEVVDELKKTVNDLESKVTDLKKENYKLLLSKDNSNEKTISANDALKKLWEGK